jgi:hypothetical protein
MSVDCPILLNESDYQGLLVIESSNWRSGFSGARDAEPGFPSFGTLVVADALDRAIWRLVKYQNGFIDSYGRKATLLLDLDLIQAIELRVVPLLRVGVELTSPELTPISNVEDQGLYIFQSVTGALESDPYEGI